MTNNSNSSTYLNSSVHVFKETKIIWSAALIVVDVLAVVLNLATILTFVVNRHLRRRSVYCLINLAVADMLFGAFKIVYRIVVMLRIKNRILWSFTIITSNTVIFISLISLVLVSLERVYAIIFPFRFRTTRLRLYIVVFTITWLTPLLLMIVLHFLPNVNRTFLYILLAVALSLSLIIICASYISLFLKVKTQAERLKPNEQQRAVIQIRQKREQYLAMTLFIVTVLSLITWLPWSIAFVIRFMRAYNIPSNLKRLVSLIRRTNSLINPIVYVFRMRDFRKALLQPIFKCSRDRQHINPIGQHGNHGRQKQSPIELQIL